MKIHTPRSRGQYLRDAALTALGWVAFGWLLVGTTVFGEMPEVSPLYSSLQGVLICVVLPLIATVLLIGWAKYNQWRFRHHDRRQTPVPLPAEQLRASFAVSPAQFTTAQTARVAVVHHDDHGQIVGIDAVQAA